MSSILEQSGLRRRWGMVPFGRLAQRQKTAGRSDLQPLSVFLGDGVVPRSDREDNHNRLGADMDKYLVVQPGDIVFNKLRTWQGGFGYSRYEGVVSPAYFVCRPQGDVEPRFLHYLLHSSPYLAELTRVSKFMPPSQFDILWDDLKALPVPKPPLAEQRAIADHLDTETTRIDALITKKRRMLNLVNERTNEAQRGLACGRVHGQAHRSSGLSWLGEIPSHWPVERLKYHARLESGHTPSRTRPELWENCSIPWVTLNDVGYLEHHEFVETTVNLISEAGLAASSARVLPEGTVILSRDATVGRCGILARPMATSQHFVDWVCSDRLRPRYLWLLLRTAMQTHFDSLTAGATLRTIGMPDVKALAVPVPPVEEQDEIVRLAEESRLRASVTATALARQIDLLVEHRQSLITAAVTGELSVPGVAA